jgi:mRNA interferase RelE/StbE
MYKIEFSRNAEKHFSRIMRSDPRMGERLAVAIDRLAHEPDLGIPLKGVLKGCFKLRAGSYRIIYRVEHSKLIVFIIKVGHRREVYR